MATASYPAGLRGCIESGKSRTTQAGFIQSDPAAGPAYTEKYTKNPPVFWTFSLIFNRYQAQVFWAWFRSTVDGGALPFIFPIRTEQGVIDHEVRFTADGTPQLVSERENVYTYSCTVMARKIEQIMSDEDVLAIFEFFGPDAGGSLANIDRAVNREWPQA